MAAHTSPDARAETPAILEPAPKSKATLPSLCGSGPPRPGQTIAIHSSRLDRRPGASLVTPLVQSTTFCQDGVGDQLDHAYSRVSNPTVAALEQVLGDLEGAPPSVCFGCGLAAETTLFLAVLHAGDHVVCSSAVYGGTVRLLDQLLAQLGIAVDFADSTHAGPVQASVRKNTRLIFVETPANPTLALTDIRAISRVAKQAGALLAVDNTFLTPLAQRPLDLGADISVYSTTKLIEGHSAALGGALTARNVDLLERFRFVRKSTGSIQTPFNAWLTVQGLKTLPVRLREQSAHAQWIAEWLTSHPFVANVHYPGLNSFGQAALANRQHLHVHGNVVSFEVVGGKDAALKMLPKLSLCTLVEHVGSVESLITHSASMTHADVPLAQRRAVGISDGLLRLSVGLEDPNDVVADLDSALRAPHDADAAASQDDTTPVRASEECTPRV